MINTTNAKKQRTKGIRLILGTLLLVGLATKSGMTQTEWAFQAEKYYQEKKYETAINIYTQQLKQYPEHSALYYNLGNAYYKKGEIGKAIYYYMVAKNKAPRDKEIEHNLRIAQQKIYNTIKMGLSLHFG